MGFKSAPACLHTADAEDWFCWLGGLQPENLVTYADVLVQLLCHINSRFIINRYCTTDFHVQLLRNVMFFSVDYNEILTSAYTYTRVASHTVSTRVCDFTFIDRLRVPEEFEFHNVEYRRRIELLGNGDFIFNRAADHRSALSRFLRTHSERPLHIQQRKKRSRAAFSHSQVIKNATSSVRIHIFIAYECAFSRDGYNAE